ncbi:hypothetical protein BEI60_25620 [Eisenbergiella tayi]|nr:hypothetical protein BEI60_25620 [Eisenbergiella tayi]
MKSEGYRILHSRGMYLFTGITAAAVFFLNWLLSCQGQIPYATAHFSLGMLVGSPMLYCYMALLAAGIMFGEDRKNGMMKNAVVYGITGPVIFMGKCMVGIFAAACSLIVIMTAYVGSARLFLPMEEMELRAVLLEIPAMSLIAGAAMMLGILVLDAVEKTAAGIVVWFFLVIGIPRGLLYLSHVLQSELLKEAALLFPENFLAEEVRVTLGGYAILWDMPQGMMKCLVSGAAGILVFTAAGILAFRKKEL